MQQFSLQDYSMTETQLFTCMYNRDVIR